jgi:hypothetical protein
MIKKVYQCERCGKYHDDPDFALDCCMPDFPEPNYLCCLCEEIFSDEDEAKDHQETEREPPDDPVSQAELEAAGQMRLIQ